MVCTARLIMLLSQVNLSGTVNGIAHSNINGTYTTIKNIKLDSYQVTAQNSDTASSTGKVGGSAVTKQLEICYMMLYNQSLVSYNQWQQL